MNINPINLNNTNNLTYKRKLNIFKRYGEKPIQKFSSKQVINFDNFYIKIQKIAKKISDIILKILDTL